MSTIRESVHDICNAIAIADGMINAVKLSLEGQLELSDEKKIDKLSKGLKAIKRIEENILTIRSEVKKNEEADNK